MANIDEARKSSADRIAELEAKVSELRAVFDLEQKRVLEATQQWQKETGRKDTWPDLGALLLWQFDRIRDLRDSLRWFGRHNDGEHGRKCDTHECGPDTCNCGFDHVLDLREPSAPEETDLVCVFCGRPWLQSVKNRCKCGFCAWGKARSQPMGEKCVSFPIIVSMSEEKGGVEQFLLINNAQELPINMKITIIATEASEECLEAVKKAYGIGYSDGYVQGQPKSSVQ